MNMLLFCMKLSGPRIGSLRFQFLTTGREGLVSLDFLLEREPSFQKLLRAFRSYESKLFRCAAVNEGGFGDGFFGDSFFGGNNQAAQAILQRPFFGGDPNLQGGQLGGQAQGTPISQAQPGEEETVSKKALCSQEEKGCLLKQLHCSLATHANVRRY
jgi:hypothetical protein